MAPGLPFPVGPGTVEVVGNAGEAIKQLELSCGADCTNEQYLQAMQDAGVIPRDPLIPAEVGRELFMLIPILGDYAAIRTAVENDDYESLLLTVTQVSRAKAAAALGRLALSMGKSPDSLPPSVRGELKYVDEPSFNPSGTGGAAKPWSTKGRINHVELPTEGKIRYVPDDNYSPSNPLPRGPNNGYLDKFGNEWVKGPSRTPGQAFEWDVQLSPRGKAQLGWASRDGSHLNISLDGKITHK